MKLKLKEYENPYWSDSSIIRAAGDVTVALNRAVTEADNIKDQRYILSQIVGEVKELCDEYNIDYDSLLSHYEEIEKWSNEDISTEEIDEAATHYWDPPEYEDDYEVEGTVSVDYPFTLTAFESWTRSDVEEYLKENFNECVDTSGMEIIDIDYSKNRPSDEDDFADTAYEEAMLSDGEEATQPQDIAKKVEYKKMVTPDFKVGSKI
jgi:hypothetical protein